MPKGRIVATEYLATELYKLKWNIEDLTFRELLIEMYINRKMSFRDIASELHVSKSTVSGWMKVYGVSVRKGNFKC